jgi:hypothetical protein
MLPGRDVSARQAVRLGFRSPLGSKRLIQQGRHVGTVPTSSARNTGFAGLSKYLVKQGRRLTINVFPLCRLFQLGQVEFLLYDV